jgi:hypothetical protein
LEDETWDVLWTDCAVTPEKFARMKLYQKINHFPGMSALSRKNNLARNLGKMKKTFPTEFNFIPKTWLIPSDMNVFKAKWTASRKTSTFIVKPEAS